MATITIKGAIFALQHRWERAPSYTFYSFDASDEHTVKVCDHEFTVEIPDDFDLRPGLVANLEREKEKLRAAFTARVTEINGQIQSLLAIENKPSEVV
ncbi:hypothetical protein BGLT_02208 [Caballeronia glathei]|uniref:Uncharacterized protein n=1 Tax=Caballeronia glathei TaxID=60547 RepID=A0A069PLJ8_9BURK|nr:hypothetical protein [Caballeronia glathei]KDR41568.1 hypothetical protein BG61_17005 [Caballeronia glathei]CDY79427.1 hypothetical protein BGLT_02208 [Caballeronia glathei]